MAQNTNKMPQPLTLPKTPEYMFSYWIETGQCFHCNLDLRHELHLFNHWKKYHSGLYPRQYYVWSGLLQRWVKVDFFQFCTAQANNVPVAVARSKHA